MQLLFAALYPSLYRTAGPGGWEEDVKLFREAIPLPYHQIRLLLFL